MESRANYILIGASIVFALICAAAFAIWLGNFQFNRTYEVFEISFKGPVRGLQDSSEVRFNGIKIGEVTDLRLDPDAPTQRVVARVRVDSAMPIKTDTIAQLELNPLTSVALIQLSGGSATAPPLRGIGGRPPRIQGRQPQLENLVMGGEDLLTNANDVILNAKEFLSKENVARLTRAIANLERASARLGEAGGAIDNANQAAINLASAGASVDKLATRVDSRFDGLADEATAAIIEARGAAASIRNLGDTYAGAMEDSSGAMPQFSAAARELQRLSTRLESLADDLDRDRAGFLAGKPRPTRELPR